MKVVFTVILSAVVFFVLFQVIPTNEEFQIYDSTVRLHILANSDSEDDQKLKLQVRDAILDTIIDFESKDKSEAIKNIEENEEQLKEIAKTVIKNNGYDYDVKIEIGKELYPTKHYEDFALPAGEYTSVRVVIGEGQGRNWWCVLYPPLCTNSAIKYDEDACIQAGLSKDQYDLITSNESGKYKVKFRFLEIASEVFGFEY
ncbi:MAG: stage II sporulation protein R [Clostridia bacterium]|nr:stage II sporulation protein R [Clostridia bacterium]